MRGLYLFEVIFNETESFIVDFILLPAIQSTRVSREHRHYQ